MSTYQSGSVVDPHHFEVDLVADPDSTYHLDADPDGDPESAFYLMRIRMLILIRIFI